MSNETKFTKGALSVNQDEQSGDYALIQSAGGGVCYVVAENITTIHDAHLFKKAHELYEMLDTVRQVLSGDSEYNADEISVDYIKQLLAEARGEL